jgi:hypothetical protein
MAASHQSNPVSPGDQSQANTLIQQSHNKHDHDDLKKTDHHLDETIKIYRRITGNNWTKTDAAAYEKIRTVSLATIDQAISIANQRAASRPNSLNYFIKEILNFQTAAEPSRAQRKKLMTAIIARVRARNVGANIGFADFVEDVKREAAREGIAFDNDLFNEILHNR